MKLRTKKFLAIIISPVRVAGWPGPVRRIALILVNVLGMFAAQRSVRRLLKSDTKGHTTGTSPSQPRAKHLHAQETYRKLIEQSLQAMVIYQAERIVYANHAAAELLKLTVSEMLALSSEQIVERVHPNDRELAFSHIPTYLTSHGPSYRCELRVIQKDGTLRWVPYLIQHEGKPAIAAIVRDITDRKWTEAERNRLFQEVQTSRKRLHARRLFEVQETERRRIARELHDEVGQLLTAIKIDLQAVQHAGQTPDLASRLDESIHSTEIALQQVSKLSIALRPSLLDDLGLVAALRAHVECQSRRAQFNPQLAIDIGDTRLSSELETICFRVAQEAMTNIVRHAHASCMRIELQPLNDHIVLRIRDDGVGVDVRAARERALHGASLGLLSMEDRVMLGGGQIEIASSPSCGTTIRVQLPMRIGIADDADWARVPI